MEFSYKQLYKVLLQKFYIIALTVIIATGCAFAILLNSAHEEYSTTFSIYYSIDKTQVPTTIKDDTTINASLIVERLNSYSFISSISCFANGELSDEIAKEFYDNTSAVVVLAEYRIRVDMKSNSLENLKLVIANYKDAFDKILIEEEGISNAIEYYSFNMVGGDERDVFSSERSPIKWVILVFFLTILLAVGAVVCYEYFMLYLKDKEQILSLQLPYLGGLMKVKNNKDKYKYNEDNYRIIRTNLLIATHDVKNPTIAINSFDHENAITNTTLNIAKSFVKLGLKTIVVDADLRERKVSGIMNYSDKMGLSEVLTDTAELNDLIVKGEYDILPAGLISEDNTENLSKIKLDECLNDLKKMYDFVFVSNASMRGCVDGDIVSGRCDFSIILTRYDIDRMINIIEMKTRIERIRSKNIGAVMVDCHREGLNFNINI